MSPEPFRLELLARHDRTAFDCGVPELNAYFHTRVGQDVKRHYATCFVAVDKQDERVAGYYTLSMGSVGLGDLPESLVKKLPRYPQAPVARLGRLAVDLNFQGQKLGGVLLADAVCRVAQSEVAAYAVVVDAKDISATRFYEHFGFLKLGRDPRTLFLPLSTAVKKLGGN
ncbi:Acetyltransferase (GNAT) family protein [Pseudobythopirellula maris]|uniref:Acetyltransferase (GNAT) family protein n=1 Tax=Pseudobythopirellula maris TaxID=2527991 RepID=A0A5C5ZH21_9BACT|nr:GNAT family N-acetyltransferase [Pseudobythopirellula maris]TWT86719.1 Acetyltransferase (GNAT) family protein [Pseudobythopirellula maris]